MKKQIISILTCITLFCSFSATAQRSQINALTDETQLLSNEDDKMRIVWWIPSEFWQIALAEEGSVSQDQIDAFIEVFDQYTLFAMADGDISTFGNVSYKTKNEIINSTYIITDDKEYHPIPTSEVSGDMTVILGMFTPVLANMLGTMGENMHFIVFQPENEKGNPLINPTEKGAFTIMLAGEAFNFRLPVGALMPAKWCEKDQEEFNGAWNYCPYCGSKLVDVKSED
ncbi:MAG: hypothetical protein CL843_12980 [Crocinitomicaceae bacterium]|nr:hypothetical protein [Crocinitomicaceae bacterium]|tara:strand:+ start:2556 stop:3239 length:684 start_codon:yes stop_codon:yes gene_type:complete